MIQRGGLKLARLKVNDLQKMNDEDLTNKLTELRADLSKLKAAAGRGTIGKDSGKIRNVKRNIARLLTIMNESLRKAEEE